MLDGNLTQPNENSEIKILDHHKSMNLYALVTYLEQGFRFWTQIGAAQCTMAIWDLFVAVVLLLWN